MKYKNIPSALHNFGDSFMSLMNYVDDTYVIDVLVDVLRGLRPPHLSFSFPAGTISPEGPYPDVLVRSVTSYASQFEQHLRSQNVDPGVLHDTVLVVEGTLLGLHAQIRARDNRGRFYTVDI